ncbi:hypothetical protein C8Q80DRAFT_96104 [Daedaleopsis nitida]|nr:hypothetical protein C8Q80DRAFT_96104 [Daedaleopsis nitida]
MCPISLIVQLRVRISTSCGCENQGNGSSTVIPAEYYGKRVDQRPPSQNTAYYVSQSRPAMESFSSLPTMFFDLSVTECVSRPHSSFNSLQWPIRQRYAVWHTGLKVEPSRVRPLLRTRAGPVGHCEAEHAWHSVRGDGPRSTGKHVDRELHLRQTNTAAGDAVVGSLASGKRIVDQARNSPGCIQYCVETKRGSMRKRPLRCSRRQEGQW